jgi:ABC-type amino acid transport substrate-binding protein
MKHKDFEDFLIDYFGKHDGKMFLDDDQIDAFDNWLENLGSDEWIELGDKYLKEQKEN